MNEVCLFVARGRKYNNSCALDLGIKIVHVGSRVNESRALFKIGSQILGDLVFGTMDNLEIDSFIDTVDSLVRVGNHNTAMVHSIRTIDIKREESSASLVFLVVIQS